MEEVRARLPGGPLGRGGRAKNFIVTHHHPSVQCLFAAQFLNDPHFKSRGSSHPFPCLCLQSQSHLSFSAAAAGAVAGSRSRERLDGGLRVVEEAGGAGAGVRRERGVCDGRAVRRRGRGGRRRGGGGGLPEGGLPLLAEGQEGAQPGRRHPLPGVWHGGRRVLRRLRRARPMRAVREQAGAGLPPLHDPQPPERALPGRRRRRRRAGLQRRVAVLVHGRQRRRLVAVAGAAAGGVARGLRQRVRGHGQGAQAPAQPGLQLQRHHRRVRHQAGPGPHRRQPRRLPRRARHHVGHGLPHRRAAHHRPQAQPASRGGADQAVRRARVRAQGRAVGGARVAPRRGLPGAGHGAVAGGPAAEAARRGVGAGGGAPPRRARGPLHHPGHGRRVGRAEQRGGGVHRVRHAAEAARVQGRGRGRRAALADQVPVVPRRRLLRRLPLPAGPGLGHQPAAAAARS
ncbi:hypothetical protein PVAP13_1KG190954 [Panicum virgatum]|uniref:Uncharacterized protein n=1 Tax=Panicum virgatum TaxID=38727 RepID=A0A8T0XED7_PANVG|nr:hypothetical protein PVAP13_1KG190954 [Panicum virgatum]